MRACIAAECIAEHCRASAPGDETCMAAQSHHQSLVPYSTPMQRQVTPLAEGNLQVA